MSESAGPKGPEGIEVVVAGPMEPDLVQHWVDFVVEGGELVVVADSRVPLLAAFHLTPGEETVRGPGPDGAEIEVPTVTGVGYSLWRIQDRCVALGGPRDRGWIGYVGSKALVGWICQQAPSVLRSP